MGGDLRLLRRASNPVCVGAGLIALDILLNGRTDGLLRLWTGGSCGNVLTILSHMGWKSYPIANLGTDSASETIINDMRRWNVNTAFIRRSREIVTPIIIERLSSNGSSAFHEFKFKCPVCGSPLPRNRPLRLELTEELVRRLPAASVFFFDRISSAAVELAKWQRSKGALIVFEPCRLSERRLFKESLEIAHIVKYSRDQIGVNNLGKKVLLEIQTLGNKGLRYRLAEKTRTERKWKRLPAFPVSKLVDSAGAGDWCTAGIVHILGQDGADGLLVKSIQEIEEALKFGQALAALKCGYEGARGLMYSLPRRDLQSIAFRLMEGKTPDWSQSDTVCEAEQGSLQKLCPSCSNNGE